MNIEVLLKEYSIQKKVLIIEIPREISDLITNERIDETQKLLKESLEGIDEIEAKACLKMMSSCTHLYRIIIHAKEEWQENRIKSTIEKAEKTIQDILPRNKYIVHCECK